jgi:ubiquinone/menaquinone biosynthesis C-methylase UbiE
MIEKHSRASAFDGLAANYDRYRIGYSSELFDVLEKLGFRRGISVLDAGCGTGLSMGPLAARGMQLVGVDPSPPMLAAAKLAVPAATFSEGSVEALPFADGTFDAAVSAQAFHWFDADKAYAELTRVVKPGGPIAVWWKILSTDDPLRALRAAASGGIGIEPAADSLRGGFSAFYRAPFAARTLRVLPFTARFRVEDWIGYERSRAAAQHAYGAKLEAYLEALRAGLVAKYGSPAAQLDVRYTQFLYLGSTPVDSTASNPSRSASPSRRAK